MITYFINGASAGILKVIRTNDMEFWELLFGYKPSFSHVENDA